MCSFETIKYGIFISAVGIRSTICVIICIIYLTLLGSQKYFPSFFYLKAVIRIMSSLLFLLLIITFTGFKFVKPWWETVQFSQRYSWISYLYNKTVIILTPERRKWQMSYRVCYYTVLNCIYKNSNAATLYSCCIFQFIVYLWINSPVLLWP